ADSVKTVAVDGDRHRLTQLTGREGQGRRRDRHVISAGFGGAVAGLVADRHRPGRGCRQRHGEGGRSGGPGGGHIQHRVRHRQNRTRSSAPRGRGDGCAGGGRGSGACGVGRGDGERVGGAVGQAGDGRGGPGRVSGDGGGAAARRGG